MKKILMFLIFFSGVFAYTPVEKYILNLPKQSLNSTEIKDIEHMREEEKLARDVYLSLYSKWKHPIFRNISKSESWHMHMIKLLINKYNLNDPVEKTNNKIGVFVDPKLQRLYYKLVKQGSKSLIDALKVGATIEDLDIKDLGEAIKRTDNKDIKIVYENLKHGSENHLRAFVRNLKRLGSNYKPKFISDEYFNQIINSSKKRKINQNYKKRVYFGKVLRVYTLPGLKKGVTWIMADVKSGKNVIRVAVAPTWAVKNANIKPGDRVRIKGFRGLYSFVACEFKDNSSGFTFYSSLPMCKN